MFCQDLLFIASRFFAVAGTFAGTAAFRTFGTFAGTFMEHGLFDPFFLEEFHHFFTGGFRIGCAQFADLFEFLCICQNVFL